LSTIGREFKIEHLKGFRGGNLLKVDTEIEADNTKVHVITPIFSEIVRESVSESVATTESIESLKFVTPPSLEEIRKELLAKSDSQSVKEDECEIIYCGSTAGGPPLN